MFCEITEEHIPALGNIMVCVEYDWAEHQSHSQPDITDFEVLAFDEYSEDWHNVTECYVANKVNLERLMLAITGYLVAQQEAV